MESYELSQEVLAKIAQDFPPEKQLKAKKLLSRYLTEEVCPDVALVQLAALELAGGKLWLLIHNVRVARFDYRDLLYWAYTRE